MFELFVSSAKLEHAFAPVYEFPGKSLPEFIEALRSATTITFLSPATVTFPDCFGCYLPFFVDGGASTHEFLESSRSTVYVRG
jgi:hypothetical protein